MSDEQCVCGCSADLRYSEYGPVGAEANFISSQLFRELSLQAGWLTGYGNIGTSAGGNQFEIQDTVSLEWTVRKKALYERPVLQFHSQDTKWKF